MAAPKRALETRDDEDTLFVSSVLPSVWQVEGFTSVR